ncbi:hypothetical protein AB0M47_31865 [Hamadaea sp. NPDC051192]|uniref:hypothetical protein n=1 Tax=Hamadaea sp. NPDC051192 TaxID=3154940 RepID=UPI00341EEE42
MSVVGDPDGRSSDQVDAAFAQIVASYDAAPAEVTWPESEDLTPAKPAEPAPAAPPAPAGPTGPLFPANGPILNQPEPSLLDGLDTFGADLPDDGEPFVPPPPPPLPRISAQAIIGVIAIIGGVVLFFKPGLLPLGDQSGMVLGLLGIIGGAALLIMRLRPGGPDEPDLPDDGAVV